MPPELKPVYNGIVFEDRTNGNGYRLYQPHNVPDEPDFEAFWDTDCLRFAELQPIMTAAMKEGAVLVSGEPGCGKTNLIEDIEAGCVSSSIPTLSVALHVNSGKRTQIRHTERLLSSFSEATAGAMSLLIIDNADYLAYRHRSRSRGRTAEYAAHIAPALIAAMEMPRVRTVGTANTSEWQENHWGWRDPAIDSLQERLLNNFNRHFVFEGTLGLGGLRREIARRMDSGNPMFPQVIAKLEELKANFHIAHHVDLSLVLEDPQTAVERVHQGRQSRMRRLLRSD